VLFEGETTTVNVGRPRSIPSNVATARRRADSPCFQSCSVGATSGRRGRRLRKVMRVRFSSQLPSEGPNEGHLSPSRDLFTFSADRQLATPPVRVVRGSARALRRARWSRGRLKSWKHQHGPPADFGTASWRCGQGSRRQRHHPSPRKPRPLSGQHFRTARFRRTVLWLVIHRGSARFEGPADELPSGAVSDRRAVVRAWEQSRRPLRRH